MPDLPTHTCPTSPQNGVASRAMERERLYQELQPLLSHLQSLYGSDPEMRQELTGEFYCRLHALHEAFDPARGIPIHPYLVRCLTMGIYTWARSEWRRRKRMIAVDPGNDHLDTLECGSAADPGIQMTESARRDYLLTALSEGVQKLSPRQREVLVARYYGGRSFDEIAGSLGVRPATVRSLARHGINNLRRQLQSQGL